MQSQIIEKKHLSAKGMLQKVKKIFNKIPSKARDPRGLKSTISLSDCLMSGLAIFSMKYSSLLQFDQEQNEETVRYNLEKLYDVKNAPCDTTLRERLDDVDPQHLRETFTSVFSALQRGKVLESYKFLNKYILFAVDGTGLFSSDKVHCENCCEKHHRNGKITYYHQMLAGVAIHPDNKEVFPLCPEPISKPDGSTKNDCEQNATKRFLQSFKKEHPHLKGVFTMDALSSRGPCIQEIKNIGAHYIIGVKPGGNKSLFEWIKGIELENHEVKTKKEFLQFRFINNIPLNDVNSDINVNFLECCIIRKNKTKTYFTWITDIEITKENIHELSRGGRARWSIENETFNTLKNQGYNFEHNFGHGYKNLTHVFSFLIFLAFLIDQVQQRCCKLFQSSLQKMISKKRLWRKMRSIFTEFYVDSWEALFNYIFNKQKIELMIINKMKIKIMFNST